MGVWHKYMQVCLYQYAASSHTVAIKLDEDYSADIPARVLRNEADFKMFEDFTECDMELEMIRAVKFQILRETVNSEIRDSLESAETEGLREALRGFQSGPAMTDFILNELLNATDETSAHSEICEENIYNRVL